MVKNIFLLEKENFVFLIKKGELIFSYEQFESSLAQQMLQMINEWQNKTSKYKQHHDIFDLTVESFITNISSSDKHDFVSIINALESKKKIK